MKAGDLRNRIMFERQTGDDVWIPHRPAWAKIEPIPGMGQSGGVIVGIKQPQFNFTTRYLKGVTHMNSRIRFGDRLFNILKIVDVENRHISLEMMCQEMVPVLDAYGNPKDI